MKNFINKERMGLLIGLLICILPWSNFFFRKVDLWHAQGHFFQMGLLALFALSFMVKPNYVQVLNKPLGIFILWVGLITGVRWMTIFEKVSQYPLKLFLPFFNLLCFVLFYKLILEYIDEDRIKKIFKYLSYSVLLMLFYCVLQRLNLDEFFRNIDGSIPIDEFVGTIGNQSHLGGYLAIIQPIFFSKSRLNILSLILLWSIIIFSHSASGIIIGIAVVLFYLIMNKKWQQSLLVAGLSVLGVIFALIKDVNFSSLSGRNIIWSDAFSMFRAHPITGYGLGYWGAQGIATGPNATWRHLHCEPYQYAIELGLIGLFLIIWLIWDYFKTFRTIKTDLTIKIVSMFLGFCLLSLVSFPTHIWIVASIGMISYSFMYVIKNNSGIQVLGENI